MHLDGRVTATGNRIYSYPMGWTPPTGRQKRLNYTDLA